MDTNETMEARVEASIARLVEMPSKIRRWDRIAKAAANWREAVRRWGVDSGGARGWLLEIVREAWGNPKLYVSPHGLGWRMKIKGHGGPFKECEWGDTELDALAAALEAAP